MWLLKFTFLVTVNYIHSLNFVFYQLGDIHSHRARYFLCQFGNIQSHWFVLCECGNIYFVLCSIVIFIVTYISCMRVVTFIMCSVRMVTYIVTILSCVSLERFMVKKLDSSGISLVTFTYIDLLCVSVVTFIVTALSCVCDKIYFVLSKHGNIHSHRARFALCQFGDIHSRWFVSYECGKIHIHSFV